MYERHFGFREEPFSLTPDPAFLYLGRQHRAAYSLLEYAVLKQAGFAVITGDAGCGKTTLIRRLIDDLAQAVTLGLIDNTHQRLTHLTEWVCMAFGLDYRSKDAVELHDTLVRFFRAQHSANRRTILVIDEAQSLGTAQIEELRSLSNVSIGKYQAVQIILVGQAELRATLERPELKQFAQRVVAHYELNAFAEDETVRYIQHRLLHAGGSPELFTPDACSLIHRHSEGVPRLINLICGAALVYGYADGASEVDRNLVARVIKDGAAGLNLPAEERRSFGKGRSPPEPTTHAPASSTESQGVPQRPHKKQDNSTFSADDARQIFSSLARDKSKA